MDDAVPVLLLDDGELDRVQALLGQLGAEYRRLRGREIGRSVPMPLDLLITSGRRVLAGEMPRLQPGAEGAPAPTWVCLHNQDFLPLRQRLRELGVHFLVQAALDQESLRLFLLQLLHRGADRRRDRRLPLGGELVYRVDAGEGKARLVELSPRACRIQVGEALAPGTRVCVVLPPALAGGEELELAARVRSCGAAETRAGSQVHPLVLEFDAPEPEAAARLEALATGRQIGTRLTPLAEPPERPLGVAPRAAPAAAVRPGSVGPTPAPDAAEPAVPTLGGERPERRAEPRLAWAGRVRAFTGDRTPHLGLARDLSLEGVYVEGDPQLVAGARVTLALYGGLRGEPIVVEAEVVRDEGSRGAALRFDSLTPDQRHGLEKLASELPPLRALDDDKRLVVSRATPRR